MSALCLRRAAPLRRTILQLRAYSSKPADAEATPVELTTPLTPGPIKPGTEAQVVRSGTLAGTKLHNINYFKAKTDPVALEDSMYPEWLWAALDSSKASGGVSNEEVGDLYCMYAVPPGRRVGPASLTGAAQPRAKSPDR